MMFAQRRNRLTTRFPERIPVVKRRISVLQRALFILMKTRSVFYAVGTQYKTVCAYINAQRYICQTQQILLCLFLY